MADANLSTLARMTSRPLLARLTDGMPCPIEHNMCSVWPTSPLLFYLLGGFRIIRGDCLSRRIFVQLRHRGDRRETIPHRERSRLCASGRTKVPPPGDG